MYFVFKIIFHHLVRQDIILIKEENLTEESKVPLDYSLYRLSTATPCPSGRCVSALTHTRMDARTVSVRALPHHAALQRFRALLLVAPVFLCLRDFCVAISAYSARELGKCKC